MRTVKTVLVTLLSAGVLSVLIAAAVIYAGLFNVAATDPHWPATYWVLETARVRSIQVHAAGRACRKPCRRPHPRPDLARFQVLLTA